MHCAGIPASQLVRGFTQIPFSFPMSSLVILAFSLMCLCVVCVHRVCAFLIFSTLLSVARSQDEPKDHQHDESN